MSYDVQKFYCNSHEAALFRERGEWDDLYMVEVPGMGISEYRGFSYREVPQHYTPTGVYYGPARNRAERRAARK